jgi:hypothetical protein
MAAMNGRCAPTLAARLFQYEHTLVATKRGAVVLTAVAA